MQLSSWSRQALTSYSGSSALNVSPLIPAKINNDSAANLQFLMNPCIRLEFDGGTVCSSFAATHSLSPVKCTTVTVLIFDGV